MTRTRGHGLEALLAARMAEMLTQSASLTNQSIQSLRHALEGLKAVRCIRYAEKMKRRVRRFKPRRRKGHLLKGRPR